MSPFKQPVVESNALSDFSKIMQKGQGSLLPNKQNTAKSISRIKGKDRINLDAEKVKNGLAQLVLSIIKLLHELLEKQAIRRIDAGSLTDAEIEKLGLTLMQQTEEINRISREFGLKEDDLNIDLGPIGKLF
ncbi:MAG: gas vesicle protein K [Candidatus Hatepunaea meridiana]|nr:gas vesicle protein K [Candidatus Hatepunaea meridiana]